jgi:hypothetical protein
MTAKALSDESEQMMIIVRNMIHQKLAGAPMSHALPVLIQQHSIRTSLLCSRLAIQLPTAVVLQVAAGTLVVYTCAVSDPAPLAGAPQICRTAA